MIRGFKMFKNAILEIGNKKYKVVIDDFNFQIIEAYEIKRGLE